MPPTPPTVQLMLLTPTLMLLTLSSLAASRSRKLSSPAVAVYLTAPLRGNSTAASTMWDGVEKFGSPTSSRMQPGVTRARLTSSRMPECAASAGPAAIAWRGRVAMESDSSNTVPPGDFGAAYARLLDDKSERSFVRFRRDAMQVKDIAYAHSGDNGDVVNVGLITVDDAAYQKLVKALSPERIKRHYGDWVRGEVEVFPMPNINGFNLLLHNALGGGATKTLRYDVTGKAFSTAILRMEIPDLSRIRNRPPRAEKRAARLTTTSVAG